MLKTARTINKMHAPTLGTTRETKGSTVGVNRVIRIWQRARHLHTQPVAVKFPGKGVSVHQEECAPINRDFLAYREICWCEEADAVILGEFMALDEHTLQKTT